MYDITQILWNYIDFLLKAILILIRPTGWFLTGSSSFKKEVMVEPPELCLNSTFITNKDRTYDEVET